MRTRKKKEDFFNREVFEEICGKISEGESLKKILKEKDVSWGAFYYFLEKNKECIEIYARAIKSRSHQKAFEIDDIKRRIIEGTILPDAGRVLLDATKWQTAKLNNADYGDRQKLEHTGADGAPLTVQVVNFGDKKTNDNDNNPV